MAEGEGKTTEEMIAEMRAVPDVKLSPEVQAQLEALDDNTLHVNLLNEVVGWLRENGGTSDNFEAAFRHAVDNLTFVAAFVLRGLKQRLGDELSPAGFAKYCYWTADDVLHWKEFNLEAQDAFEDTFDPRPLPPGDVVRDAVKTLIIEHLSTQPKPVLRHTIHSRVIACYRDGRSGFRDVADACTAALKELAGDGTVRRYRGRYSLVGVGLATRAVKPNGTLNAITSEEAEATRHFIPEETIGEGDECVYVYFNETERKLAKHEGRDWWPCKIGFTSRSSVTTRLMEQRPATGIGRPPIVGLLIKTDDGRGLERTLHFALDRVATRIDDAVGDEWFETSPLKIKEWYLAHQQSLGVLKR